MGIPDVPEDFRHRRQERQLIVENVQREKNASSERLWQEEGACYEKDNRKEQELLFHGSREEAR